MIFVVYVSGEPSRKKRKISKAEKCMEKAIDAFLTHHEAAEERFVKQEEERWEKETELEDKRRSEDRAHEMRMLQIMAQGQGREGTTSMTTSMTTPTINSI